MWKISERIKVIAALILAISLVQVQPARAFLSDLLGLPSIFGELEPALLDKLGISEDIISFSQSFYEATGLTPIEAAGLAEQLWEAIESGDLDALSEIALGENLDPCSNTGVVFIIAPEPGWCLVERSAEEIIIDDGTGGEGTPDGEEGDGSSDGEGGNGSPDGDGGDGNSRSNPVSVLLESMGSLGVPDPTTTRARARELADNGGSMNIFDSNTEVQAYYIANMLDRASTKTVINSVLSKEAQANEKKRLEAVGEMTSNGVKSAEEAQKFDATQDVVKTLVSLQAQENVLLSMQYQKSSQNRIDNQMTNTNLANISRSLDEEHRSRRAEGRINSLTVFGAAASTSLF